jgi:ATP-dependent protease ClpP protease subunit
MGKKRIRKPAIEPVEIPVIGDVDDWEAETIKTLLEVPIGGECVFYIDSAGGSVYGALAVLTLVRHRRLRATGLVLGECSSAALLLFAGCQRRLVTPYSTLLFHHMRWQSDKRVAAGEASQWARHFEQLERDIDALQIRLFGLAAEQLHAWTDSGRYVTGPELAAAGLAELLEV